MPLLCSPPLNKRPDQALRALKWLRGRGLETEDEFVSMKQGMEDKREEEDGDVYSFLLSAPALKPLGICTLLMVFQQFSGINAVMFYSVSIFVASGSPSPHASTVILGIVNIAATILSNLLIDRLGRKVGQQSPKARLPEYPIWDKGADADYVVINTNCTTIRCCCKSPVSG